ncbi:hypothetical protein RSAG8_08621, partial [Rhizoctonia solani AG-8 WAC10335]
MSHHSHRTNRSVRSHRLPWEDRPIDYERETPRSALRDNVLPRDSRPVDSPTNPFGAGALPFSNISTPSDPFGPTRVPPETSPPPEGLFYRQREPSPMMIDTEPLATPMPPGGLRITPPQVPAIALSSPPIITPPRATVRTPTASQSSHQADSVMVDIPLTAANTPRRSTVSNESLEREAELRSHLHSHRASQEGSTYSETVRIEHREMQAILLDPDNQAADSELTKYLPYAPGTTMYILRPDEAKEFEFMPASAGRTSQVRLHKEVNDFRKIFRRMGRVFYRLNMPTPEENRYPSRSCEAWAKHIFDILDKVVTFRPTCRITTMRIPAQEIHQWPEYGELYVALTQLINKSITRPSDIESLLPLPEWPASECLFHAHAFEVAAVSFRDQVERTIQKLYDIISIKITDRAPSPVISTGEFTEVDPMQEDLRDRTMRLDPNSSLIVPKDVRAILPPPDPSQPSSPRGSSRSVLSSHHARSPPIVSTAQLVEDVIQMMESPVRTNESQPSSTGISTTPPETSIEQTESLRRPEPPYSIAVSTTQEVFNRSPTSRDGTIRTQSMVNATMRPIRSPGSAAPTIRSPPASGRLTISPTILGTINEESEARIRRPPTPRPHYSLVPPASTGGTASWVHTPTEPQGNLPQANQTSRSSSSSDRSQQQEDVLEERTLRRLAELIARPVPMPRISAQALEEYINQPSNESIERLSTPTSIQADESDVPHIVAPPSPADSVLSVSSAATRILRVPVAESTPRRSAVQERDEIRPARDLPPHVELINRRTSLGGASRSGRPAGPADHFARSEPVGSEEEPDRYRAPSEESARTLPSRHSRHQEEEAPLDEPNRSRRNNFMAPLRPHLAVRPVAPAQPTNRNELPAHIRSRMASSRRFSELYVDTSVVTRWDDFLDKVAWHEDKLLNKEVTGTSDIQRQLNEMKSMLKRLETNKHSGRTAVRSHQAASKPVGWHKNNPAPPYPKDDNTVSKGKTPKDKKARPCRHCGSLMHWDRDCKYAKQNSRTVRAHLAEASEDEWAAQEAYEELCDDAYMEESDSEPEEEASEEDFHEPLRSLAASAAAYTPAEVQQGSGGNDTGSESDSAGKADQEATTFTGLIQSKIPTRKSFIKQLKLATTKVFSAKTGEEITLKRLMSRPPGTAFFGAKATIIKGWIQNAVGSKKRITFDSGSEITLINESLLKTLDPPPRVRIGQKLRLIQVTNSGPVKMIVEAYVVPDMNTPFILGTDFAAQYQLSLVRSEDGTKIVFGDTGRSIPVEESDSTPRVDKQGNAFLVEVAQGYIQNGSEITLINESLLKTLDPPPRVRIGQKLRLIQVTNSGPVKMIVEAYVVPDMNTPFILGTDFAAQYQLSLVRSEDGTKIVFGDTGRSIPVEESDSTPRVDKQGNAFLVEVAQGYIQNGDKRSKARKEYKRRSKDKQLPSNTVKVKVYQTVTIPAHSIKMVKVKTTWKEGQYEGYIDRAFNTHRSEEDIFAISDSIIERNNPRIQVSNLSPQPVRLQGGEVIGYMHDPKEYLAHIADLSEEDKDNFIKYSNLIQAIALKKAEEKPTEEEEELMKSPEGGPKTAETPDPEEIPSRRLVKEIHFSEQLTAEQRNKLEKIVIKNELTFGLDGRLGTHDAQVEINLRPNTKEISLTPYSASPAKREIIDKQIDDWLRLEVIEPSKSAWGFPVIVVYRNSKPRVCIDYRRLNEVSIPDEYPLPKQTDILHALEGSQWLTTLDALAGFTQLSIKEEDRAKTAFRCHRGLYQFKRLPFGFRNGPSVFQRVMNTFTVQLSKTTVNI